MKYVNLGASGLKVSRISLGMMTFGSPEWRPWIRDEETAREVVRKAVELGVNAYMGKPYQEAELLAAIAGFVKRSS